MPGIMYFCKICGYSSISEDLVTKCENGHRLAEDLTVHSVEHKKLEGLIFPQAVVLEDKRTGARERYVR